MSHDRRSLRALAALLPAGALGLSISLAAADAQATVSPNTGTRRTDSVATRLQNIRNTVSNVLSEAAKEGDASSTPEDGIRLAQWGNGWHNGGWGNGGWGNNGWHNGGWGNNGWGNGGAIPLPLPLLTPFGNNWGNGWHNGWHNW
jgi:rSAM-associated Gly-rich repeat protein